MRAETNTFVSRTIFCRPRQLAAIFLLSLFPTISRDFFDDLFHRHLVRAFGLCVFTNETQRFREGLWLFWRAAFRKGFLGAHKLSQRPNLFRV